MSTFFVFRFKVSRPLFLSWLMNCLCFVFRVLGLKRNVLMSKVWVEFMKILHQFPFFIFYYLPLFISRLLPLLMCHLHPFQMLKVCIYYFPTSQMPMLRNFLLQKHKLCLRDLITVYLYIGDFLLSMMVGRWIW